MFMSLCGACEYDWTVVDHLADASLEGAGGQDGSTGAAGRPSTQDAATDAPQEAGLALSFLATVTDCIAIAGQAPNPDQCTGSQVPQTMDVDLKDNTLGSESPPVGAFLRFDLDDAWAGRNIVQATLVLRTSAAFDANSMSSGVLWQVAPFDRMSLFTQVPAKQGSTPLGPDLGPVTPNQKVQWSLPPSLIQAGKSVYVGILPVLTNGTLYMTKDSAAPPVLEIRTEP